MSLDGIPTDENSIRFERDIPDDIVLEIALYLPSPEILKFCLVAKRIYALLVPSLYTSVELETNQQCRLIFKTFSRHPELANFVGNLVVCPSRPSSWAGIVYDKPLKESEIAASVEQLASAGSLKHLHTFRWQGTEAPRDTLWWALKTYCPFLKIIGTTVGIKTQVFGPDSHLFSFRGLRGFSLSTQKSARWPSLLTGQNLPIRFWDMLLIHSPDLEELKLDGTCNTYPLWNYRKILSGNWPRLKRLSLGSLSVHELPNDDEAMASFLSAHPTLEEIKFLSGVYYSRSSMFYVPTLPNLQCFSGRIQQLKKSGDLPALRHLQLTDWFSPSARFTEMIYFVPHISSLSICVNFLDAISRPSCLALYERVLRACPGLSHVEISATGPIVLKDFSQAIQRAPLLRSFVITRTRRLTDEDMNAGALRIANQNPQLHSFTIRDVSDWDHADQLDGKCRFRQIGSYFILADDSHKAHSLRIHESGVNNFGRRYLRSSTTALRP